ncbi:hypothetical protein ACH160_004724 [Vibrio alginolyticus]
MTWKVNNCSANVIANNLLKRDSQRVAFLACVDFSDKGGMQRLQYCVAHPLAGRYVLIEKGK